MNDILQDEQAFVPEVDAASLQAAHLPPAESPPPAPVAHQAQPAAPPLPTDPEQAMQALPPALAAHIQDLITEAEAIGYLRGRNEQIEAIEHFDDPNDDCDIAPSPIPRYNRHSIWDL